MESLKGEIVELLFCFGEECLLFLVPEDEYMTSFSINPQWRSEALDVEILDRLCFTKIWEPFITSGFFDNWLQSLCRIDKAHFEESNKELKWPEGALRERMLHISAQMIELPRAEFVMGDPKEKTHKQHCYPSEYSQSTMGKFLVSQILWKEHMGFITEPYSNPMSPVSHVSFFDAIIFCNRLSAHYNKKPCYELNEKLIQQADGYSGREREVFWSQNYGQFDIVFYNAPHGFRIPYNFEWEFLAQASFRYFDVDRKEQRSLNAFGAVDVVGSMNQWVWTEKDEKQKGITSLLRGNKDIYQEEPCTRFFMITSVGLRLASSKMRVF